MAKIVIDADELYSVDEAAEKLGRGVATIWRYIRDRKITVVRLGNRTLIPVTEIERIKKATDGEAVA
ncbi:helix-turn-helix domain-containing protein [Patescibacteria group bacterium]|nr:helix-turn-helix domain-containing protein [Patescibacteria group bacterium]